MCSASNEAPPPGHRTATLLICPVLHAEKTLEAYLVAIHRVLIRAMLRMHPDPSTNSAVRLAEPMGALRPCAGHLPGRHQRPTKSSCRLWPCTVQCADQHAHCQMDASERKRGAGVGREAEAFPLPPLGPFFCSALTRVPEASDDSGRVEFLASTASAKATFSV
jgi:hypothetical protein